MKIVGNDQVLISKEELDALLMVATMYCCEKDPDAIKNIKISHAANVSVMVEEHIWGNKQIPEEVLLQVRNFIKREEGVKKDAGSI